MCLSLNAAHHSWTVVWNMAILVFIRRMRYKICTPMWSRELDNKGIVRNNTVELKRLKRDHELNCLVYHGQKIGLIDHYWVSWIMNTTTELWLTYSTIEATVLWHVTRGSPGQLASCKWPCWKALLMINHIKGSLKGSEWMDGIEQRTGPK